MAEKLNILFLCTGNSCRSQMAEGWTHHIKGDIISASSAGTEPQGLNPCAVRVMAETGVDISQHKSRHIDEFKGTVPDIVVTVCGHAEKACPVFPENCKVVHVGFDDPPLLAKKLAMGGASEETQLDCYRRVRDEIRRFVETLPDSLNVTIQHP